MSEKRPDQPDNLPANPGTAAVEQSPNKEVSVPENRLLILGSRMSGAFSLSDAFEAEFTARNILMPSIEVNRHANSITASIFGGIPETKNERPPRFPKAIILLPEMRAETETGMKMTLDVNDSGIAKYVRDLCMKHGIHLIEIEKFSDEQIEADLKNLLIPPSE